MAWQAYVPHAIGGGAVSGSVLLMLFKDSIREWWSQRARDRILAKEERLAEKTSGSYLQKELLSILKQELASNASLLGKLNDTMGDFRDVMREYTKNVDRLSTLVESVHEHQKFLKFKWGEGPQ